MDVSNLQRAAQYLPEPKLSTRQVFDGIFSTISKVASVGGVPSAATGDFASLINQQIEAQKELQSTTMVSNIERSKHETKMSAIRNIRVG